MVEPGSSSDSDHNATLLLNAAAGGDARAAEQLLALVYEQLRNVARGQMAGERAGHTLAPTALVHEAYLKLVGPRDVPWKNRAHFYGAAAEAMRRILIDHARSHGAAKRGGKTARRDLADVTDLASSDPEEIVRFDGAFLRLESESPEAATVVRFRFYAGLTVAQTAEAMGVSTSTVDRHWMFARAWLLRHTYDEA